MQLHPLYPIALSLLISGCGQVKAQDNQETQLKTTHGAQEAEIINTANGLIEKKLEWAIFSDSQTDKYVQFRLVDGEVYANFPVYFYKSKLYKHENTITEDSECSGEEPVLNKEDFVKTSYMSSSEIKNLKAIILPQGIDHFVSYCKKYDMNGEFMGHSANIDFRFPHPAHEWPAQIQDLFNKTRGTSPREISIESEARSL